MDVAEAVTKAAIDQLETEIEAVQADAFIAGYRACYGDLSGVPHLDLPFDDDELDDLIDAALDKYMKGQGEA